MNARVLIGDIVSFDAAPKHYGDNVMPRHIAGGALVVGSDGRIAWSGERSGLPEGYRNAPVDDWRGRLILPGFVDAHIHFPQYRMLAAPGLDLLDWLARFTFPEEARYGDPLWAAARAGDFLKALFRHGTTSALAFSSVHKCAAEALFAAAETGGHGAGDRQDHDGPQRPARRRGRCRDIGHRVGRADPGLAWARTPAVCHHPALCRHLLGRPASRWRAIW